MSRRLIDTRKSVPSFTHDDLITAGCWLLANRRLPYNTWWKRVSEEPLKVEQNTPKMKIVLPEMFTWKARPDVIGFHLFGFSVVLECKASRSDFLRDHHKPNAHPGDIVYYLTPPGIIDAERDADRLADHGAIEWDGRAFTVLRLPTQDPEAETFCPNLEASILVRVLMYEKIEGIRDYRGTQPRDAVGIF